MTLAARYQPGTFGWMRYKQADQVGTSCVPGAPQARSRSSGELSSLRMAELSLDSRASRSWRAPVPGVLHLQHMAGNRATNSLLESPPTPVASTTAAVVQRLFGMEKETKVPVSLAQDNIKGYPKIAEAPGVFKVDVDHSGGQSILEFVMTAFDEHHGFDSEAHSELDRRLNIIEGFIAAAILAPKGTQFEEVAHRFGAEPVSPYGKATLNDSASPTPDKGPVHFTVGFSLEAMPQLIKDRLASRDKSKGHLPQRRAKGAASLADWARQELSKPAAPKSARIPGFISTVYMQIAALMDGAKETDPGLKKNLTNVLSRVSPGLMFSELREDERDWLRRNTDTILMQMRKVYSGRDDAWGDHKLDRDLVPKPAKKLIGAAFTGNAYTPDTDFGKMTVVSASEGVGPETATRGYAMELRREKLASDAPRDVRVKHAHELLAYSRQIHGTNDLTVFLATASSIS